MATGWREPRQRGLALLLVGGVLLRLPTLFDPPWVNDEGTYTTIGHMLWAGAPGSLLYQTIWDNKPPVIYLLYAAADGLGGPAHRLLLIRLASLLAAGAIQLLVYRMGQRVGGAGLLAATMACLLLNLPVLEGTTANAEIFLAPCTLGGLFLLGFPGRARAPSVGMTLAAGGLLGLATATKLVAGADLVAASLWLGWLWWQRLGWLWLGAAVPWLLIALVYLLHGKAALAAAIYAIVTYNLGYVGAGHAVAHGMPWPTVIVALVPLLATAAVWRWRGESWATPLLWAGWALAGSAASGRLYPHYLLQAVAPLALLTATLWHGAWPALARRGAAPLFVFALIALLATSVIAGRAGPLAVAARPTPLAYGALVWWRLTGQEDDATFARALDPHAAAVLTLAPILATACGHPAQSLFVWGNRPWLYALSGLADPTPFTSTYYHPPVGGEMAAIEAALRRRPADVVVVVQPPTPPLPAAIARLWQGYQSVGARAGLTVLCQREGRASQAG